MTSTVKFFRLYDRLASFTHCYDARISHNSLHAWPPTCVSSSPRTAVPASRYIGADPITMTRMCRKRVRRGRNVRKVRFALACSCWSNSETISRPKMWKNPQTRSVRRGTVLGSNRYADALRQEGVLWPSCQVPSENNSDYCGPLRFRTPSRPANGKRAWHAFG